MIRRSLSLQEALPAKLLSVVSCIAAALHSADSQASSAEAILQGSVWLAGILHPFKMEARRKVLQQVLMCLAYEPEAAGFELRAENQSLPSRFLSTCRGFVAAYLQTYISRDVVEKELTSSHTSQGLPRSHKQSRGQLLSRSAEEAVVAELAAPYLPNVADLEEYEQSEEVSNEEPLAVRLSYQGQGERFEHPQPSLSSEVEQITPEGLPPDQVWGYPMYGPQEPPNKQTSIYWDNSESSPAQRFSKFPVQGLVSKGATMLKPMQRYALADSIICLPHTFVRSNNFHVDTG